MIVFHSATTMLTTRSDHIVAAEYRDLQTNAMAVDSQGKFALLASKRCIALGEYCELGFSRTGLPAEWI